MTAAQLREYLAGQRTGWVVTGHSAPDTDAVVSALFEGYRLTAAGTPATPVVQGPLPREAAWLLGDLAPLLPVADPLEPTCPLVLTDHHERGDYPNPVVAVVDHHPVAPDTDWTGVDAEIAPVGAATTLVARRLRRDGITPDGVCARILLGAILLDTEGLSPHKARPEDTETAAWLGGLCGEDPAALFAALREALLSEGDVATLYRRDYRRYTDPAGNQRLGWAILKVWEEACPDLNAVRRLLAEDSAPTRVAKIVLTRRTDAARTEWYLAAGQEAQELLELVQTVAGQTATRVAGDAVFLPETALHAGRKRYVALLGQRWREKS